MFRSQTYQSRFNSTSSYGYEIQESRRDKLGRYVRESSIRGIVTIADTESLEKAVQKVNEAIIDAHQENGLERANQDVRRCEVCSTKLKTEMSIGQNSSTKVRRSSVNRRKNRQHAPESIEISPWTVLPTQ